MTVSRGPIARFVAAVLAANAVAAGPSLAADPSPPHDLSSQARKAAPKTRPAPARPEKPTLPPRESFTAFEQQSAAIPGIPDARFWADSETAYLAALPSAQGPWLALSSGGADGAFGAGILVGLTAAGQRPDFALVTGVSTGALMAPFVFAGPRYDAQLKESYTTITSADIFELGGQGESFFDTWPLKDAIAKRVTPALLADVAAEHRKGRRLFVLTTNLDIERPVAWNMGAIAAAGDRRALELFRAVLLAATSIPGAFPPVLIEVRANGHTFREMHGDGGLHNQFFVAPAKMMASTSSYRLPAPIYLIINTSLTPTFVVTPRDTIAILNRAVAAGVRTLTRAMIDITYAAARRSDVPFHLAVIDPKFDAPSRGAFDPDYMTALFTFGFEQGKNGLAFRMAP
ncbi:MAG: patatin-like phospholipase family protein [Pseudorhodoplanes sp.]|nr:patatin-like phospholipase family protein [Pseudorhodoplanes sp.]